MFAIDYSGFHPGCKNVFLINTSDQVMVCCPEHRVVISLAQAGRKIEPATANEPDPDKRILYKGGN